MQRHPLAAGLVALLGIALAATLFLLRLRERALVATQAAISTTEAAILARHAADVGQSAPQLGLRLALAAAAREDTLETRSEVYTAVARARELARIRHDAEGLFGIAFSPDGALGMSWGDGGRCEANWRSIGGQLEGNWRKEDPVAGGRMQVGALLPR